MYARDPWHLRVESGGDGPARRRLGDHGPLAGGRGRPAAAEPPGCHGRRRSPPTPTAADRIRNARRVGESGRGIGSATVGCTGPVGAAEAPSDGLAAVSNDHVTAVPTATATIAATYPSTPVPRASDVYDMTPTSPKAPNPARATAKRRRAASPSAAPSTSELTTMPATRAGLSLVPKTPDGELLQRGGEPVDEAVGHRCDERGPVVPEGGDQLARREGRARPEEAGERGPRLGNGAERSGGHNDRMPGRPSRRPNRSRNKRETPAALRPAPRRVDLRSSAWPSR